MDVFSELERFKTKKKEVVGYIEGYLTTTHTDSFGDKLDLEHIRLFQDSIPEIKFLTDEHDLSKPPVGKILQSELRKLEDGEYALWAKAEVYDKKMAERKGFSVAFGCL